MRIPWENDMPIDWSQFTADDGEVATKDINWNDFEADTNAVAQADAPALPRNSGVAPPVGDAETKDYFLAPPTPATSPELEGIYAKARKDARPTKEQLAAEQADIASRGEVTLGNYITSPFAGALRQGRKATGRALQGLDALAAATPPGILNDTQSFNPEWDKRRAAMTPEQKRIQLEAGPLFQTGQALHDTANEAFPNVDPEGLPTKIGEGAGGFLPAVLTGPLAPAVFGLQTAGEQLTQGYDELIKQGADPGTAADTAAKRAVQNGTMQGLLFEFLPKPLKSIGDAALDKLAYEGTARFLAGRVANTAKGAAFGAGTQVAANLSNEHPWYEGIGQAAEGMALIDAIMPRGMTKAEVKEYNYNARDALITKQQIDFNVNREAFRKHMLEKAQLTDQHMEELHQLQEARKSGEPMSPEEADRLKALEFLTGKQDVLLPEQKAMVDQVAKEQGVDWTEQTEFGMAQHQYTGRVAYYDTKAGKVVVNPAELSLVMSGLKPAKRKAYLESLLSEENIHGMITDDQAREFVSNATLAEKEAAVRRYTGTASGRTLEEGKKISEVELGHEMIRAKMQQLMGIKPTELTSSSAGLHRELTAGLLKIENIIHSVRGLLARGKTDKPVNLQNAILDTLQRKVDAIKEQRNFAPGQRVEVLPSDLPGAPRDARRLENNQAVESNQPFSVRRSEVEAMTPEKFLETSRDWAKQSMGGAGMTVQGRAEVAALQEPNLSEWEKSYQKASEQAKQVKAEFQANPQLMQDPEFQKRFMGAAQMTQFFSEGRDILNGSKQPSKEAVAAMSRPASLRRGEKLKDRLQRQAAELRLRKLEAEGVPIPEELKKTLGLREHGTVEQPTPVPPEERTSTNFPRLTSQTMEAEAEAEINRPTNAKGKLKMAEAKSEIGRNNPAPGEKVSRMRVEAERPSFDRFAKKMRDVTVDVKKEQLQEIWADRVWGELTKATPERLAELRKALGLEGKYGSRAMGEDPLGRRDITGPEKAPEVTSEQAMRQREILRKRIAKLEEDAKQKLRDADNYEANVTEESAKPREGELFGATDQGQALRQQAFELRYKATVMRRSLEAASDESRTLRRKADVRPMTHLPMGEVLKEASGEAKKRLAELHSQLKSMENAGVPSDDKDVIRVENEIEDLEQKVKGESGVLNRPNRPAERAGMAGVSQAAYRQKVIRAIAQQLIGESYKHENRRANMDRTDISIDDVDFNNKKTQVGSYYEITPGDLEIKRDAHGDVPDITPPLLRKILTDQARGKNTDPESASRRVVVVVGLDNKVYLLSVYNDSGRIMVTDPEVRGAHRPYRELTSSFIKKYHPVSTLLLKDPVKGLRQEFSGMAEFRDKIGQEAKDRSEVGDNLLEGLHPEQHEVEGTAGLEGNMGLFQGPKKGAMDLEQRNPALHSKAPLSRLEAFMVSKYESTREVRDAIEDLQLALKDGKKLSPRQVVLVNAFRKISERIEAGRKMNPELTSDPELSQQQTIDRVANRLMWFNQSPTPVKAMLREFGSRLPESLPRNSGVGREIQTPPKYSPNLHRAFRRGSDKPMLPRVPIKPPTRQDVFAGPFQRKAAPSGELGADRPYIPEGMKAEAPGEREAGIKEERGYQLEEMRDKALRNVIRTMRKRGKVVTLDEALKNIGGMTKDDIAELKQRGPMSVRREGEMDKPTKGDTRTFIYHTEKLLRALPQDKIINRQQFIATMKNKLPPDEWKTLEISGFLDHLRDPLLEADRAGLTPRDAMDLLDASAPNIHVRIDRSDAKDPEITARFNPMEQQKFNKLESRRDDLAHNWLDTLNYHQKNDVEILHTRYSDDSVMGDKSPQEWLREERKWSENDIEKWVEFDQISTDMQQMEDMAERKVSRFTRKASSIYPRAQVLPRDTDNNPVHRVDVILNNARDEGRYAAEMEAAPGHAPHRNTLGWAAIQFQNVNGEKVAHIFELQSDWAKRSGFPGGMRVPALEHHKRIILKAALKYAHDQGATRFAITDQPTASMTESHDAHPVVEPGSYDVSRSLDKGRDLYYDHVKGSVWGAKDMRRRVRLGDSKQNDFTQIRLTGNIRVPGKDPIDFRSGRNSNVEVEANPVEGEVRGSFFPRLKRKFSLSQLPEEAANEILHGLLSEHGRPIHEEGMRFNYDASARLVDRKTGKTIKTFDSRKEAARYVDKMADHGFLSRDALDPEVGTLNIVQGELHKTAEQLSGSEGERISFGRHYKADTRNQEAERGEQRTNLFYKDAEGKPKTDASGKAYPMPKMDKPFSVFGPHSVRRDYVHDLTGAEEKMSEFRPVGNYWMDREGKIYKVNSHWDGASQIIKKSDNKKVTPNYDAITELINKRGFVRIAMDRKRNYGLMLEAGEITPSQRKALKRISEDHNITVTWDRGVNRVETLFEPWSPGSLRRSIPKNAGKFVTDAIKGGASWYDEWMVDRMERLGGDKAAEAGSAFRGVIDRAKAVYGELTPTLDPAKTLAAGSEMIENSRTFKKLGKTISGIVGQIPSLTQLRAVHWANKLKETPRYKWTAVSNVVDLFEGGATVPPFAQRLVDAAKAANLDIGKTLESVSHYFKATGKFQRNFTAMAYDIVRNGRGLEWRRWTKGLALENGMPIDQVRQIFRDMKTELDKPGIDMAHLEKMNQDFNRKLPKVVTHLKVNGMWEPLVHADLFNYLENTAQRAAHLKAFRETFPNTPAGRLKLADMRESVSTEMGASGQASFDALIRTMQGIPTDNYTPGFPGSTARTLNNTVGQLLAKAALTGQIFVQPGENLAGSTPVFLGYKNYLRGMARIGELYPQLEIFGAVNRAMHDFSFNKNSPIRSAFRAAGNTVSKLSMQQALNELQEASAAATAHVVAERISTNNLTKWEKRMLPQTFKAMGFNSEEIMGIMSGDEALLGQFVRKAAAFLTSGNRAISEGSKLGANRLFNSVFRFQSYPMMKINQLRKVTGNLAEAWTSGNAQQKRASTEMFTRFLLGNTMQGAATVGITALFFGGATGLGIALKEAADQKFKFLLESFMATATGPMYLAMRGMKDKGATGVGDAAMRMIFPYSATTELIDMTQGLGRYRDQDTTEKIGTFIAARTPGTRAIGQGLALFGLSQDDKKLDSAMTALFRWKRDKFGFDESRQYLKDDPSKEFKIQMRNAVMAMRRGDQDAFQEAYMKAAGEKVDLMKKGGVSFSARKVMRTATGEPLNEDQKEELRQRIGDDAVDRLEYYDLMLDAAGNGSMIPSYDK